MGRASDLMAEIYRDQWENYKSTYFPYEEQLIESYQNPETQSRLLSQAQTDTAQAHDTARDTYRRSLSRTTANVDNQTAGETSRVFNLSEARSQVDARNRVRRGLADQDRAILAGGLTTSSLAAGEEPQ